jgi:hypothetical protein
MTQSPDDLLAYGEAAKYVEICPGKLVRMVNEGLLPHPDEFMRFKRSDLDKLREKLHASRRNTGVS